MAERKKTPRNLMLAVIAMFVAIVAVVLIFAISKGKMQNRSVDVEVEKKVKTYEEAPPPSPGQIDTIARKQEIELAEEKKKANAPPLPPPYTQEGANIDAMMPPTREEVERGNRKEEKTMPTGGAPVDLRQAPMSNAARNMMMPEVYENYGDERRAARLIQGQRPAQTGPAQEAKKDDLPKVKDDLPKVSVTTPSVAPTRYYLREGATIDVVLLNGVNTESPGRVQLRTVSDVYDSLGDRRLLIPKGSVLIGGFSQAVTQAGLARIPVFVNRIMLPDGRSIKLNRNPLGDEQGYEGAPAEFHSNLLTAIGPSALVTWIGYLIDKKQAEAQAARQVPQGQQGVQPPNISQQIMPKIEQRISERFGAARAYYTIDPGARLALVISEDLAIPPYQEAR